MWLYRKEDGPRDMVSLSVPGNERERTSGTPRCPFPDVPRIETAHGIELARLATADSRDVFRAVSENDAGRGRAVARRRVR